MAKQYDPHYYVEYDYGTIDFDRYNEDVWRDTVLRGRGSPTRVYVDAPFTLGSVSHKVKHRGKTELKHPTRHFGFTDFEYLVIYIQSFSKMP